MNKKPLRSYKIEEPKSLQMLYFRNNISSELHCNPAKKLKTSQFYRIPISKLRSKTCHFTITRTFLFKKIKKLSMGTLGAKYMKFFWGLESVNPNLKNDIDFCISCNHIGCNCINHISCFHTAFKNINQKLSLNCNIGYQNYNFQNYIKNDIQDGNKKNDIQNVNKTNKNEIIFDHNIYDEYKIYRIIKHQTVKHQTILKNLFSQNFIKSKNFIKKQKILFKYFMIFPKSSFSFILSMLFILLLIPSIFFIPKALAMPVFDYANYIENIAIAKNTLESITRQAEQIRYQIQNLRSLESYNVRDISPLIEKLDNTINQGQAVAYSMSDLDSAFKQKYPDYVNYSRSEYNNIDYSEAYKTWSSSTLDTLKNTLNASHIEASNFNEEQSILSNLKSQAQNASGNMQIQQTLTEISAENVNQLHELKRIMVSQINAQNIYMANKISKDSYTEKSLEEITQNLNTEFPKYTDNPNFGKICRY